MSAVGSSTEPGSDASQGPLIIQSSNRAFVPKPSISGRHPNLQAGRHDSHGYWIVPKLAVQTLDFIVVGPAGLEPATRPL
jgi:hypothetical protein